MRSWRCAGCHSIVPEGLLAGVQRQHRSICIPSSYPCQRRGLVPVVSRISIAEVVAGALTVLGSSHKAASHCSGMCLGCMVEVRERMRAAPEATVQ